MDAVAGQKGTKNRHTKESSLGHTHRVIQGVHVLIFQAAWLTKYSSTRNPAPDLFIHRLGIVQIFPGVAAETSRGFHVWVDSTILHSASIYSQNRREDDQSIWKTYKSGRGARKGLVKQPYPQGTNIPKSPVAKRRVKIRPRFLSERCA